MPGPGYKRKKLPGPSRVAGRRGRQMGSAPVTTPPAAPVVNSAGVVTRPSSSRAQLARGSGEPIPAPTPRYSPSSRATTTVNLRPLISTIADPATRTLARYALKSGIAHEVNPSVLLALAGEESKFGRDRKGKGYAGFTKETAKRLADEHGVDALKGPKDAIEAAAIYLRRAGFHDNPRKAITQYGQGSAEYARRVAKAASGWKELDNAARKIEAAPGDTYVRGVGQIKGRNPKDRPSVARKLKRAVANSAEIEGPLTPEQKKFALAFSRASGLSPRVAAAAVLREGGNGTPGDNNWLNIGWTDSGPTEVTRDPAWRDPTTAGEAAGKWIRGEWGQQYGYVASPGIQAIPQAKGDDAQMQAWANSGWASSGASPADTYNQVSASTRDVPDKLIDRARKTLGKKRTQAILRGSTGEAKPPPRKEVNRWLVPTESRAEVAAELGVPRKRAGIEIHRLDPEFQRRLLAVAKESGEPLRINEGFRTTYRQEQLASGQGGATGPAAAPGTSKHETGNAADIDLTAKQQALLPKHGLSNDVVAGEPWHVEMVDGGGGVAPVSDGGGSGASAAVGSPGAPAPQQVRKKKKPRPTSARPIQSPTSARAPMPQTAQEPSSEDEDLLAYFRPKKRQTRRVG